MAGPGRWQYEPVFSPRTVQQVVDSGRLMGVPEVTVEKDQNTVYVLFHWPHGETKIYPNLDQDHPGETVPRYTPRSGDIGIVDIHGHVGSLIRVGQWLNGDGFANLTHAFVYVGDGDVIEAMPGGALLSPLSRYDNDEILWLKCPREYGDAVASAARSFGPQYDGDGRLIRKGVPYSFADYGALALHRFRIPTPRLKRYVESSGHQICSQLCDRAAELGGWHLFRDQRWSGYVTPGDLVRLARAQLRVAR